jgi:hypothetical protein
VLLRIALYDDLMSLFCEPELYRVLPASALVVALLETALSVSTIGVYASYTTKGSGLSTLKF